MTRPLTPPMRTVEHDSMRSRFSHAEIVSTKPPRPLSDAAAPIRERRTVFPSTVVDAGRSPRLLVSGHNNPKIGRIVEKGKWAGMPVYTLTLEERATCPDTCHMYRACMGNSMPFARRHRVGREFEERLEIELMVKNAVHFDGFVVRLHVLGDFYSVHYVRLWERWLRRFPALRVFGFTARLPGTRIGDAVRRLREAEWERFAIRFSRPRSSDGHREAVTIGPGESQGDAILCPAQAHQTAACVTCGLCWSAPERTIAFRAHGNPGRAGSRARPENHGTGQ